MLRCAIIPSILIGFSVLGALALYWDLHSYWSLNLRVRDAVTLAFAARAWASVIDGVGLVFLWGIAVPFAIGLVRAIAEEAPDTRASGPRMLSLAFYWAVCAGLAALAAISNSMQVLSGAIGGQNADGFLYTSVVQSLFVPGSELVIASGSTVMLAIVLPLIPNLLTGGRAPWANRLWWKCRMLSLRGGHAPCVGGAELDVAMAAPSIRDIEKSSQNRIASVELLIQRGKSIEATTATLVDECLSKLRVLEILPDSVHEGWQIELYPSTARAIEVAVMTWGRSVGVVLSPFEHKRELVALRGIREFAGVAVGAVAMKSRWLDVDDAKLINEVSDGIKKVAEESSLAPSQTVVLILSEVAYLNGRVLPVKAITAAVRAKLPGRSLRVVLDGTHGLGNIMWTWPVDGWDAYVASGHRWLLSPSPIGICVFPEIASGREPYHDGVDRSGQSSGLMIQTLVRFSCALDVWIVHGRVAAEKRILRLQRELLELAGPQLSVVGHEKIRHIGIALLVPGEGFEWSKTAEQLASDLGKHRIHASWHDVDRTTVGIRFSISLFTQMGDITRAVAVLKRGVHGEAPEPAVPTVPEPNAPAPAEAAKSTPPEAAKTTPALQVSTPSSSIGDAAQLLEKWVGILRRMDRVVLSEYVVVGKYFRFDQHTRNVLYEKMGQLRAPLQRVTQNRENFLIWAAPGSGKTFLIRQLAAALGDSIKYVECNLAEDPKEEFLRKINSLKSIDGPVLCLLDEIDARAEETWPYEECFSKLDLNVECGRQIVFVLVGSRESSVESLVDLISRRPKGRDLVSRIPLEEKSFTIPALAPEDSVVVVLGQVDALLAGKIRSVEKLALLYILSNAQLRSSPRQLTEFVKSAVHRMNGHDRLMYHHLFVAGSKLQHSFYSGLPPGVRADVDDVDIQIAH